MSSIPHHLNNIDEIPHVPDLEQKIASALTSALRWHEGRYEHAGDRCHAFEAGVLEYQIRQIGFLIDDHGHFRSKHAWKIVGDVLDISRNKILNTDCLTIPELQLSKTMNAFTCRCNAIPPMHCAWLRTSGKARCYLYRRILPGILQDIMKFETDIQ